MSPNDHRSEAPLDEPLRVPAEATTRPSLPPRWFITSVWRAHRLLVKLSGGRLGLWRPKAGGWGAMRLTTIGRRTGRERRVVVGYFEDGPNLVTLAMNGWGDADPEWWLNLQANPNAEVEVVGGPRRVCARVSEGDERERLWARWEEIDENLDAFAAIRHRETAVVVLEPRLSGDLPAVEESDQLERHVTAG